MTLPRDDLEEICLRQAWATPVQMEYREVSNSKSTYRHWYIPIMVSNQPRGKGSSQSASSMNRSRISFASAQYLRIDSDIQVIHTKLPIHDTLAVVEVSIDAEALELVPGRIAERHYVNVQHLVVAHWKVHVPQDGFVVELGAIED